MPKNKGKGGKKRKRGKGDGDGTKRDLITKTEDQEYAQVTKMLGNGRIEALCFDGKTRLAHIRGKMRKRVWVNSGDIVLLGLREYQDGKADVLLKYNEEDVRALKRLGHLPQSAQITSEKREEDDLPFDFSGGGEEEGSEEADVGAQPDRYGDLPNYSDSDSGSEEDEESGELNIDNL